MSEKVIDFGKKWIKIQYEPDQETAALERWISLKLLAATFDGQKR